LNNSNDKIDIDELLVRKAQKGDTEAFEMLVSKYEKKIYNISFRMLSDRDEAADAAQDVFIKVFRSLKNFKGESLFSTWLYRITSNVCLDILRKRKSNVVSFDAEFVQDDGEVKFEPPSTDPGVEEEYEQSELKKLVSDAVNELPETHRAMIVMRDFEDLSYSDIARILDCPEGTIKSRISRARSALKSLLISKRELNGYISV